MHVGMYDCMRYESESELGNQLSGVLTKANKQTCILVCLCKYMCMRSESESTLVTLVTTAAQECASDLCMCARVCVCWYYFTHLWTVSVCLQVHTVTQTHTHTQATRKTQAYTCQVMIENQHFHSSTVSQYSAPSNTHTHTKAMKPRQKHRVAGLTTGCWTNQSPCVEEKKRLSQPAVRYTKTKQKKNTFIHTQAHKYARWYVRLYEDRERIRVRQPAGRCTQKNKQTNMHTRVSV